MKPLSHDASNLVPEAVISDGSQGPDTEMHGRMPRDASYTPPPWMVEPGAWISGLHAHRRAIIATCSDDGAVSESYQAANAAFIVKAVNNHEALLIFFQWAMQEGPWQGNDLDGASIQDKAESLGLIVSVPYDPEKHGAYNDYGCDAGDPWFEFSPRLNPPVGGGQEP